MRISAIAAALAALAGGCAFSAHPLSGQQACSNDDPPQCPDGYACVAGMCYDNNQLPACGGAHQLCCEGNTCTATDTVCSSGSCTACGGANQLCCTGDACSALGALCSATTTTASGTGCLLACAAITGTCVSGTDLDCYSPCGPGKIGSKTCTCASDAWKCPACSFPTGADYSCYKLPATVPLCDATTTPTAGASCTAAACSACGATNGKGFIDVAGVARAGYCVCTSNRWNCALTKEWPCPGNLGC
jgi:hypothetical protein